MFASSKLKSHWPALHLGSAAVFAMRIATTRSVPKLPEVYSALSTDIVITFRYGGEATENERRPKMG